MAPTAFTRYTVAASAMSKTSSKYVVLTHAIELILTLLLQTVLALQAEDGT